MWKPPDLTQAQKVVSTATASDQKSVPFGAGGRKVQNIDQLALKGPGYDPEVAYLMAVISAWSYADENVLTSKLRYYGLPHVRIRRITVQNNALLVATTAYLIQSESGKSAVLAFRGTDPANFIAVMTDGQVMQHPFLGNHVHTGFYTSVEVVWDEVHEALETARRGQPLSFEQGNQNTLAPLENLYVTGHSLGGAMAVLAASRLFQRDYERWQSKTLIKGVYTFGQPMVGDDGYAALCDALFGDRLFRHVFAKDVVPHLPPKSQLDYAHSGLELRAEGVNDNFALQSEVSGRARLISTLFEVMINALESRTMTRDLFPGYTIDDHLPDKYLAVCRRKLEPESALLTSSSGLFARIGELANKLDPSRQRRRSQPRPS